MFLLNRESLEWLDSGASPQGTTHVFGDDRTRVKDLGRPEAWIAHDETRIRRLHERAHLRIEPPIRYGNWPGREASGPGFGGKDIIVAVRGRQGLPHLLVRGRNSS
jgi:hypothetical protein